MKWSHDYKRDGLHPNKTQTRTCTCLHDDVRCKQSMAFDVKTHNRTIHKAKTMSNTDHTKNRE